MEIAKDQEKLSDDLPFFDAYEQKIKSDIKKTLSYIYQEPAIVLSILYLSVSIIGISYLAFIFFFFGINILSHIELTDFVLGAIHYPKTLLIFVGQLSFLLFVVKIDSIIKNRYFTYRRFLNKYHKRLPSSPPLLAYTIAVLIYLISAAFLQAKVTYKDLLANQSEQLNVQLGNEIVTEEVKLSSLLGVQVIANLSKHLWLYQHKTKKVFVLPHESVLMITPILPLENVDEDKTLSFTTIKKVSTNKIPLSSKEITKGINNE